MKVTIEIPSGLVDRLTRKAAHDGQDIAGYVQRLTIREVEPDLERAEEDDRTAQAAQPRRIIAEADFAHPRTMEELAAARRHFLASAPREFAEETLPPVLLSEG